MCWRQDTLRYTWTSQCFKMLDKWSSLCNEFQVPAAAATLALLSMHVGPRMFTTFQKPFQRRPLSMMPLSFGAGERAISRSVAVLSLFVMRELNVPRTSQLLFHFGRAVNMAPTQVIIESRRTLLGMNTNRSNNGSVQYLVLWLRREDLASRNATREKRKKRKKQK